MTWNVPNSSDDSWSPLPPPTRFDPTALHQPPTLSTLPPPPPPPLTPKARGRHRLAVAACVAGFVIGIGGGAAWRHFENGGSSSPLALADSAVPTTSSPAPPTTGATSPAVPGPRRTSPPSYASPVPAPASPTPTQSDLTVGVVNVNTVLGYQQAEGAGTGIVLSSNGEILTNNHVIDGATKITVTVVATGKSYNASVVGTDRTDDIAVLRLDGVSGLAIARLGDSSTVKIGDAVVGVGNAGGLGTPTSSSGSVVQLGQTITATDDNGGNPETLHDLIEISAQLQPGQSGGPLYDAAGKVVGLDAAGNAGSGGGRFRVRTASTTGYAIPINDAMAVAKEIEAGKASSTITIGTPPMLGIGATNTTSPVAGAMITDVATGTPAAKIGLKPGDVIVAVGDTKVTSVSDLTLALQAHKAGDKVAITWTSEGVTHTATATTIAGPAN
jgi:S1-C subfamily serine protease